VILVADASAVVDFLIGGPRGQRVGAHLARSDAVAAPELIDVEVLSALRRLTLAGHITDADATTCARHFVTMPIRRLGHAALATQVWALRDRVRIADGFYLATARLVGEPLLTCDARLARAPVPDVAVLVVS
jgi:predicted nucleic acid-binding protein